MELKANELQKVTGGGLGALALIGIGIVFLIGLIDGYVRPYKCR